MTFDEFWKNRPRGIFTDEDYAKMAWDASIEEAALAVEARGARIGGAIRPDKTAKEIRALSSNAAVKPRRSDV